MSQAPHFTLSFLGPAVPITEVVRVICTAPGLDQSGKSIQVDLRVDVDGRFGKDEDALGFPAFWIKVPGELIGPFEHEDEAVKLAESRFQARFP